MATKRKLTNKQMKELPSIGIALGTGVLTQKVQDLLNDNVQFLGNNPVITSSLTGLIGSAMVLFGSDKLNPSGYAMIGASGFDLTDDLGEAVQGITRLDQSQGITRLDSQMEGVRIVDEEEEREI
jgi:hypothetical protein